jgi:[acyl-carrier-protein] S-malonyltransferase
MLGRRVSSLEESASVLFGQVARPSLWAQTLGAMDADGYSLFAEVGPGDVLTRLLRWTLREARGLVVESPETAAAFAAAISAAVPAPRKAAARA